MFLYTFDCLEALLLYVCLNKRCFCKMIFYDKKGWKKFLDFITSSEAKISCLHTNDTGCLYVLKQKENSFNKTTTATSNDKRGFYGYHRDKSSIMFTFWVHAKHKLLDTYKYIYDYAHITAYYTANLYIFEKTTSERMTEL